MFGTHETLAPAPPQGGLFTAAGRGMVGFTRAIYRRGRSRLAGVCEHGEVAMVNWLWLAIAGLVAWFLFFSNTTPVA